MDYFDILLAKKLSGGGGGDIEVETLNATENGTYNAGTGKAYNPVVVAVPEPTLIAKSISQNGTYNASDDNADGYSSVTVDVEGYQIKNIANVPTDIASFSDGTDLPMLKLEVGIEAVQDLNGYDAPWPAGGGANKWDGVWELGEINSSDGVEVPSTTVWRSVNYTPIFDSNQYVFVVPNASENKRMKARFYASDKSYIGYSASDGTQVFSNVPFTPPSGAAYVRFAPNVSDIPEHIVALNYPSTVTTYAPYSNICPISGWSAVNVSVVGVNTWDEEWEVGNYNTTTGEPFGTTGIRSINLIPIKPNTIYRNIKGGTGGYIWALFYDSNKTLITGYNTGSQSSANASNITNITFTTPPNGAYMKIYATSGYGDTYNNDISINYPSTDTDYHAYNGQTYTIQLGSTYYGGKLDVVSGVLTVDRAEVDLGTLNWTAQTDSQGTYFRSSKPNGMKAVQSGVIPNALCSIYPTTTSSNVYDGSIAFSVGSEGYTFARDTRFADATAFKTAMDGVQLVYELATPLTVQLTPTQVKSLLNDNNIWADSGQIISGQYFAEL